MSTAQLIFIASGIVGALTLFGGGRMGRIGATGQRVQPSRSTDDAPVDAGSMLVRVLVAAGCTGAGWALLGGALGVGIGVGAAVGSWMLLSRVEAPQVRRRRAAMQARFATVLDLLAGVAEAGAPLRTAAADVAEVVGAPSNEPLLAVGAACRVGCSDAEAWLTLADDPLWGDVARELARSVESGSAGTRILRSHAEQARRTRTATLMTRARSVGVMSALPLMCCFLPAFLLVGVVPIIGGLVGTYLP